MKDLTFKEVANRINVMGEADKERKAVVFTPDGKVYAVGKFQTAAGVDGLLDGKGEVDMEDFVMVLKEIVDKRVKAYREGERWVIEVYHNDKMMARVPNVEMPFKTDAELMKKTRKWVDDLGYDNAEYHYSFNFMGKEL